MSALSNHELIRYSRQLLLPEMDENAQVTLKNARVLIVGLGGLGSPAAFYLAASGIGKLVLVDDDKVELSNLQRQILFKINHIGQSKSNAASKTLQALNNQIVVESVCSRLDLGNAEKLMASSDLVLDCSDNFDTRYLINRLAKKYCKPLISGAAMGWKGQLCTVDNRQQSAPCYECLFPKTDSTVAQNCDTLGVISPILGMVGSHQALAAIQMLLNIGDVPQFIQIDGLTMKQTLYSFAVSKSCPTCRG